MIRFVEDAPMNDLIQWLFWVIVLLIGAWCRSQEKRIDAHEDFKTEVLKHWATEARMYMSKADFSEFAKEVKDALLRIEDKIEKLRK
jgi:hypothetical protein